MWYYYCMSKITKEIRLLACSALLLGGVFLFSYSSVFGAAGAIDFGGNMITSVVECTCSTGSQISVTGYGRKNSKHTGTYLYTPGTIVIKGKVEPGKKIIGQYTSGGGQCLITGTPCEKLPITKGTFKIISTN